MSATILIDMRVLQDARYIERGIAAHTRSAVVLAREVSAMARQARIIGLIDPDMDELPPDVVAMADELRPNGYLPGLPSGSVFLNPSPMSPGQIFVARLLENPAIRKAAMVYDFIPFDEPTRYLRDLALKLDYFSAMAWLNRYDLFLPISATTDGRLRTLFNVGSRPSVVTGVPLAPWLETETRHEPRHVLVVAGDDPRKNPEIVVRAHASCRILQDQRVKLIITGHYPPARQAYFREIAARGGGDADLLTMPGRVAQEVLLAQYRAAFCVVTPSRAEGFSMPVIEAMAAGVPSIVSDIPAHASLVRDPDLRFGTEDDARLTTLLNRIAADQAFRDGIIAAQAEIWPAFRASAVAAKVWSAIETMVEPALPLIAVTGKRPRIAMLTPLPPAKSGVADYSALLAKSLAKHVELSLFSESESENAQSVSALPHLMHGFDRVVSVMGNSSMHFDIHDLLLQFGGACICHDARLLGFTVSRFSLAHAARLAGAELGRVVREDEVETWLGDESQRQADLLGALATAARPLIFHTRHSVEMVRMRFGKQAFFLPFALYRHWENIVISEPVRTAARERLGIARDQFLIASFGFIHGTKGIDAALRALAILAQRGVACQLYWVGQNHQDIGAFEKLAASLGVSDRVHFTNRYFSDNEYRDYILAADAGLQLRLGALGNVSGALSDCIAGGLPCVASRDIADNVAAPSFVRRVADLPDPVEIADAFTGLFEAGISREARREESFAYCARHSMANYARGLCEILEL